MAIVIAKIVQKNDILVFYVNLVEKTDCIVVYLVISMCSGIVRMFCAAV